MALSRLGRRLLKFRRQRQWQSCLAATAALPPLVISAARPSLASSTTAAAGGLDSIRPLPAGRPLMPAGLLLRRRRCALTRLTAVA